MDQLTKQAGATAYIDGNDYHPITLSDVKQGDFFVRKAGAVRVYTRGEYDRGSKTFAANDCLDFNKEIFLKGSTIVYVGFTY